MQHAWFCQITQVLIIAVQKSYTTNMINKGSEFIKHFPNTRYLFDASKCVQMTLRRKRLNEIKKNIKNYTNNSFRLASSKSKEKVNILFWVEPSPYRLIENIDHCIASQTFHCNPISIVLNENLMLCQSLWHSGETFSVHLKSYRLGIRHVLHLLCVTTAVSSNAARYSHVLESAVLRNNDSIVLFSLHF